MCNPLEERFGEWEEWLLGDDVHSIRNQIHNMIWDSAVYQSINEARAYAPTDAKGRIELNAMVHHFVDRCFFDTQMMAIRRLVDSETRSGKRSVTSLWRLLHGLEEEAASLTRKNILGCLDLPYDYGTAREEIRTERALTPRPALMGDDHKRCFSSKIMHKNIDVLAGIDSSQRSPTDQLQVTIVQWLKAKLEECKSVYRYVNKFLAHAATPESRADLSDDGMKITLGQILHAHVIICQIAEFVGQNIFLRSIGNPLPIPHFDQFEYLEKPWVREETLGELRKWWHAYEDSTNEWRGWGTTGWLSEYAAWKDRRHCH